MALVALQTRWPRLAATLADKKPDEVKSFLQAMSVIDDGSGQDGHTGLLQPYFHKDEQFTKGDNRQPIDWWTSEQFSDLTTFMGFLWKMLGEAKESDGGILAPLFAWFAALALTSVGVSETKESGWERFVKALEKKLAMPLAIQLRQRRWQALKTVSTHSRLSFNIVIPSPDGDEFHPVLSVTETGAILVVTTAWEGAPDKIRSVFDAASRDVRQGANGTLWKEYGNGTRLRWDGETTEGTRGPPLDGLLKYLGRVDRAWAELCASPPTSGVGAEGAREPVGAASDGDAAQRVEVDAVGACNAHPSNAIGGKGT